MLRGGVIGFGRMGLTHFSILNSHPDVALVAVCDSSGFVLRNTAKYMGVETFKDPQQMLDKVPMDFVVVTTPTAYHADMAMRAIAKGLHVFVEKPFTLEPRQAQDVLQSLRDKALVNQVGYVLRFSDIFMQVKRLLDSRVLGELLVFKMETNGPTILRDAKQSWRSKKSEGGGCLHDFASHSVDLINYLIGPPDTVVGTVLQRIHSADVEDAISSTFLYKSGTRGNLLVNWSDPSYRKPAYHFEVLGRKGKLIADLHAYRVFFRERPSFEDFTEGWNQRYVTDCFAPVGFYLRGYEFTRQLEYFVDCVLEKHPNRMCTFQHAFQTDMVIDRIRRSEGTTEVLDG